MATDPTNLPMWHSCGTPRTTQGGDPWQGRSTSDKFIFKNHIGNPDANKVFRDSRAESSLPESVHNSFGPQRAVQLARYALSPQGASVAEVNQYCDSAVAQYTRHVAEMKRNDLYRENLNVEWDSREYLTAEEVSEFCHSSDLWKGLAHPSGPQGMILKTQRSGTGEDVDDISAFVAWMRLPPCKATQAERFTRAGFEQQQALLSSQSMPGKVPDECPDRYHLFACKATQDERFKRDVFEQQALLRFQLLEGDVRNDLREKIWKDKWFFTKMWYWSSDWTYFDRWHEIDSMTERQTKQKAMKEMADIKARQQETAFEHCLAGFILHRVDGTNQLTQDGHDHLR